MIRINTTFFKEQITRLHSYESNWTVKKSSSFHLWSDCKRMERLKEVWPSSINYTNNKKTWFPFRNSSTEVSKSTRKESRKRMFGTWVKGTRSEARSPENDVSLLNKSPRKDVTAVEFYRTYLSFHWFVNKKKCMFSACYKEIQYYRYIKAVGDTFWGKPELMISWNS